MASWPCRYVHFSIFIACIVLFSPPTVILGDTIAPAQEDTSAKPADSARPTDGADSLSVDEQDEYYELMKLFVDTVDEVERNYVRPISRRKLMEAAIDGVLSKLDTYSDYIAPDDVDTFRREMESEFGGIGIQVGSEGRNGPIVVITPLVGTPAYRAGLKPGDKILEVDGTATKGLTVNDAVKLMKGRLGTEVALKLQRSGGTIETVNIRRDVVRLDTVVSHYRKPNDQWQFMFDAEKGIGYIRLTAFSRHTTDDLRKALEELTSQNFKGLVLDLRFNPGGLLDAAIEVSDLFLSEGRIVSTSGRNVDERVWEASKKGTFSGFPMVVLVNRYSASASEIVAACLQDHKRAIVIGARTWGKGSVQRVIDLEEGRSALKLTTASYLRPNGHNIHRFPDFTEDDEWGVRPNEDMEVALERPEIGQLWDYQSRQVLSTDRDANNVYVDRQLHKALDVLTAELAE
jgi:carboxyl-terminal processing protease